MKKVGFIGCGNMAQAIIGGIINASVVKNNNIIASAPSNKSLDKMKQLYNIQCTNNNIEVAKSADILFLAVKPYLFAKVIDEIKYVVKEDVQIVSIAAGITIENIEECFNKEIKVCRTMPNTPALVGEGMTAVSYNKFINDEEKKYIQSIFNACGKCEEIDEKLMDVIPSVSGSSPAYVYMFIEALSDGAVLNGMPRDKSYKFAAQAVLGAAKMVLETNEHPGALKDKVCSPGGTTIEAVYSLEKNNFRGTVIEAMQCCTNKAINMSKKK